jgi:hypothetical protein
MTDNNVHEEVASGTKLLARTSGSEPLRVYSSVWHMPWRRKSVKGEHGGKVGVGSYLPV